MKKSLLKISILLVSLILICNICFAVVDSHPSLVSANPNATKAPVTSNNNTDQKITSIDKSKLTEEEIKELYEGFDQENIKAGDVYLAQETISLEEYIDGNVYVFGDKINISSQMIKGNVFAIGNDITLNSDIEGSVYVIGKNVIVNGGLSDAYIGGETVELKDNSYIKRDVRIFANEAKLNGRIDNNAYVTAAKTIIDSTSPLTKINGELHYSDEIEKNESVSIGSLIKEESVFDNKEVKEEAAAVGEAVNKTFDSIGLITCLVCGIITIAIVGLLFKNSNENVVMNQKNQGKNPYLVPFLDALKGLGLMILIPIALIVLLFTIIGIPASFIGALVYALLVMASIPVASLVIIRTYFNDKIKGNGLQILSAMILYLLISLVKVIPVIGGIIRAIIMWYGFYKILTIGKRYSNNKKVEVEPVVIEK